MAIFLQRLIAMQAWLLQVVCGGGGEAGTARLAPTFTWDADNGNRLILKDRPWPTPAPTISAVPVPSHW